MNEPAYVGPPGGTRITPTHRCFALPRSLTFTNQWYAHIITVFVQDFHVGFPAACEDTTTWEALDYLRKMIRQGRLGTRWR